MKPKARRFLKFLLILVCIIFLVGFIKIAKDLIATRAKLKNTELELVFVKLQKEKVQQKLEDKIQELEIANKQLSQINQKASALEKDNAELIKAKHDLENRIIALEDQKQHFEATLHSLEELKKCIRQAEREIQEKRIKDYLARKQLQRLKDSDKLLKGNRGFLTKQGKPTYNPVVVIEVEPGG